jgi:hypothetical protein
VDELYEGGGNCKDIYKKFNDKLKAVKNIDKRKLEKIKRRKEKGKKKTAVQ